MKTMQVFRILSVLLTVFAIFAAASPANAGIGTHHQIILPADPTDSIVGAADNPCGFDLYIHDEGYYRISYWVDENERTVREFDIYGNFHETITVGNKTLKVLIQGPAHFEATYPAPNIAVVYVKIIGTQGLITIPGYGKVWGGAGLTEEIHTWDVSDFDNWKLISDTLVRRVGNINWDNWGPLCEYLGL